VKFFFDRSLSRRLVNAIRALEGPRSGVEVQFKDERFAIDTDDTVWIAVLATEGNWIVVSLDPEILRKPVERAAWREAGLTGFSTTAVGAISSSTSRPGASSAGGRS